jgi:beta-catenin-like protein 1
VTLLADLVEMDEDISPGRYDDLFEFCEALLGNQLIGLLIDNMRRLNEEDADEADAVFKSLGIIESLVEVDATLLEDAKSMNSLQSFLVTRYYNSIPSQNRDYAAELTAMLIASVSEFREAFVTSDQGVDLTLAAVAPFKDRDPQDADEAEYFENLFDILCAASLEPTGQERFLQAQGTHLLALLLKQVNMARIRALKLLSYVLTGPKFAQEACDAFVDALGLKVIFPIFMKKGQASLAKYKQFSARSEDEFLATILTALVRFMGDSPRVKGKFEEHEGEKAKQAIAMYNLYKIKANEAKDEDEREALLFTYRQFALILMYILNKTASSHLITEPQEVRQVLSELLQTVDNDDLKSFIESLLN